MSGRILIDDVKAVVAEEFALKPSVIYGRSRVRSVVYPRQIAMHLARRLTPLSTTIIGKLFGGFDHATVMHATARVVRDCHDLPRLEAKVLEHAAARRANLPPPIIPEIIPEPEPDPWLLMESAPRDGTVIRVLTKGPKGFQELPYAVLFADGHWRYASNNGRVFPWHRPLRWRAA